MFHSKLPHTGTSIFTVVSALSNEHGAINLSQGFPNFDPPEQLMQLVFAHMRAGHNQYAPMAGLPALREQLARSMNGRYGVAIDPEREITITAGATQAIFTAVATVVRPGDEVILLEPAYDSYRPSVEVMGGTVRAYALAAPDFRVDWAAVGQLITERTRMIILNTPHNPTGTVLTTDDWTQLAALIADRDIYVLSDEVYEHLTYDGRRHESLLPHPQLYARAFVTYSFGKTFHSTGWKVGYCVAPPELTAEFRKVHQFNVFSVNTPIQYALADYLKREDAFAGLADFYQQKRDFLQAQLADSPLRPLACAGSYFQLYDYRAVSDLPDTDFVHRLIKEQGVAAIPISAFFRDGRQDGLIRLCFAKTEKTLAAAAERLRSLSAVVH